MTNSGQKGASSFSRRYHKIFVASGTIAAAIIAVLSGSSYYHVHQLTDDASYRPDAWTKTMALTAEKAYLSKIADEARFNDARWKAITEIIAAQQKSIEKLDDTIFAMSEKCAASIATATFLQRQIDTILINSD
jgi:hypothetical protein